MARTGLIATVCLMVMAGCVTGTPSSVSINADVAHISATNLIELELRAGAPAPAPAPAEAEDGEDEDEDAPVAGEDSSGQVSNPGTTSDQDVVEAREITWGSKPSDMAGVFIPYDKHLPTKGGVNYFTASGHQECTLCKNIIAQAYGYGESYHDLCSPVGASADMRPMCEAQMKTLQACPEFMNHWCYQDLGGTQQLRAPCPDHLICHYCLGLNPLHCTGYEA